MDLKKIISQGESETVEFKKSPSESKEIIKSTLQMSKDEYERLILEKHKDKLYFDSQICKEAALADIDKEKIRWFLKKAKTERNLDIDYTASPSEALKRLNLLVDNKPNNTAILMFGKNPQRFFIQSEIRCARFKGIKAVKPSTPFFS